MDVIDDRLANPSTRAALTGVGAAMTSFGSTFLALDCDFRVVYASPSLDRLLGPNAAHRATGVPIEDLAGGALFGPGGTLRQALEAGSRRMEPRTWLPGQPPQSAPVTVTVAPLSLPDDADPAHRIAHMVVVGQADAELDAPFISGVAGLPGSTDSETDRLRRALDAHRWSRRDTARALGISRTTLWRLMRDHGLQRDIDDEP